MPAIRLRTVLALAALSVLLLLLYGPIPAEPVPFPHPPGTALLVTAHPDDESMFFAPTLLSLIAAGWDAWVLCLSVGNADGLGDVRRRELGEAMEVMGVGRDRVEMVDDRRLPDSMTTPWDAEPILEHLTSFLKVHDNISLIITFDDQGVSGHVNHASLPRALLSKSGTRYPPLPPAYMLLSSPLPPKFISFLSWFIPLHDTPSARYSLDFPQYAHAVRAMLAHHSQMVWFRWLYISFSRYMWTNEYVPLVSLSLSTSSTSPASPVPPQQPMKEEL